MKSGYLLLVIFLVVIGSRLGRPQVFDWARGMGVGYAVSTDTAGNSYVTGYFSGTAQFGTIYLTSSGEKDIFIAKYDNVGNFIWAKKAGGNSNDYGYGISTDVIGNCYVLGTFGEDFTGGSATFGGITTLTSYGYSDIFLAKYDNEGNFLWVKQAGGNSVEQGNAISTDDNGNCYIIGSFSGTATFGSTTLTRYGYNDIFIAKYDNAGNFQWVNQSGGESYDYGNGIATDANGNSYITGNFSWTTSFGSTTLTSNGEWDIYIAKFNNSGNCLWAKSVGGISSDYSNKVVIDANGNSYVTGRFNGTTTFGTTTLTSYGGFDIFIAKFDNAGNSLWVKQAGGNSNYYLDYGNQIVVDINGNSYITGTFNGTATFDTATLTTYTADAGDIFIAKYNNAGNFLWVKQAGGYYDDIGYGISALTNGSIYVTGRAPGSANFGTIQISTYGGFITKVSQTPTGLDDILEIPTKYTLSQNYPNPFNNSCAIKYSIPNSSQVKLTIINTLGEELETLVDEEKSAGTYKLNWNAVNLPSGVYFYRLQAGSFVQTRKMILLK